MMKVLPSVAIVSTTLACAISGAPLAQNSLYTRYLTQHKLEQSDQAIKQFATDFIHSLHQPTPRIDSLLPATSVDLLKAKRDEYGLLCPKIDPLSSTWMQRQVSKIMTIDTVTDETLLALWESFRKLPCPSLVDFDPQVYAHTFQSVFAVPADHPTRHNQSDELVHLYDGKLRGPMTTILSEYNQQLDMSAADKILLAVDAWDRGYQNDTDQDKIVKIKHFIMSQDFHPKSLFSRLRQLLSGGGGRQQVRRLTRKFDPATNAPQSHWWNATLKLYVDFCNRWQPTDPVVCPHLPNHVLQDFFRHVVRSFHSPHHGLPAVEPHLQDGLRFFRQQPGVADMDPFADAQFRRQFCATVDRPDKSVFEKVVVLHDHFSRIPALATLSAQHDLHVIRRAYGSV